VPRTIRFVDRAAFGSCVVAFLLLCPVSALAAQDCSGGQFDGSEPYAFDERLPFDFHHPTGWEAMATTDGFRMVTVGKPPSDVAMGATAVTMDIFVSLKPDLYPENTEDTWRQTMPIIAEVPYADKTLLMFSQPWAIAAKFLVPYAASGTASS